MGISSSKRKKPYHTASTNPGFTKDLARNPTATFNWHEQTFGGSLEDVNRELQKPYYASKCDAVLRKNQAKTAVGNNFCTRPKVTYIKPLNNDCTKRPTQSIGTDITSQPMKESKGPLQVDKTGSTTSTSYSIVGSNQRSDKKELSQQRQICGMYGQIAFQTKCRQVILSSHRTRIGDPYSTQVKTTNNSILKETANGVSGVKILSPRSVRWAEGGPKLAEKIAEPATTTKPSITSKPPLPPFIKQKSALIKTNTEPEIQTKEQRRPICTSKIRIRPIKTGSKVVTEKVRRLLDGTRDTKENSKEFEKVIPLTDRIKSWTRPANI